MTWDFTQSLLPGVECRESVFGCGWRSRAWQVEERELQGLRIDSDALRGLPPASRGLPHPWALPPASPPDPSVPLLQTSFPKEDISYAALTLDTPNQELIYSNMDGLTNHLYHQSHEEATEYSTIMKP